MQLRFVILLNKKRVPNYIGTLSKKNGDGSAEPMNGFSERNVSLLTNCTASDTFFGETKALLATTGIFVQMRAKDKFI